MDQTPKSEMSDSGLADSEMANSELRTTRSKLDSLADGFAPLGDADSRTRNVASLKSRLEQLSDRASGARKSPGVWESIKDEFNRDFGVLRDEIDRLDKESMSR